MPAGFKVADGYVEVHARYDKGELRRAAQNAADDNDAAFNKERERNARSGPTRDTNRRIGRQASVDFVKGMQDQVKRQKETPIIRTEDVKRDATRLGRVHVQEFAREAEQEVDRRRSLFHRLGTRITDRIRTGLTSRESMGNVVAGFFTRFIEIASFGQADIGMSRLAGPIAASFAKIGVVAGAAFVGAIVMQIANLITGALPLLVGGLIAALPIFTLLRSGMKKEDGKWVTRANEMGKALHKLVGLAKLFVKTVSEPFKPFLLGMLQSLTDSMVRIRPVIQELVRGIGPSFMLFFDGFVRGIEAFAKALVPALPGINEGLKTWGKELPGIAKAFGDMIAEILKDPAAVHDAIVDFSDFLKAVMTDGAQVVVFVTKIARAWSKLSTAIDGFEGKMDGVMRALTKPFNGWEVWVKPFMTKFLAFFRELPGKAVAAIGNFGDKIAAKIKSGQDKITAWAKGIVTKVVAFLKELPGKAAAAVGGFGDRVAAKIKAAQDKITAKARDIVNKVVTFLKGLPAKAAAAVSSLWSRMSGAFTRATTGARGKATDLVNRVVAFLRGLPGKAASAVHSLWSRMSGSFTSMVSNAVARGRDLVSRFISAISSLPSKAAAVARRVKGAVQGALAGAGGWLVSAGRAIMQGLASGISAGYNAVVGAIRRVASAAVAAAKSALKIGSPSKVFADEVGVPVAQGIGMGAEKQMPKEFKRIRSMVPSTGATAAAATAGGTTYHTTSSWNPTIHVHVQAGLETVNSAAKRALTKDIFLALEQYRKDYVDR
jgi:hypothetical protein